MSMEPDSLDGILCLEIQAEAIEEAMHLDNDCLDGILESSMIESEGGNIYD